MQLPTWLPRAPQLRSRCLGVARLCRPWLPRQGVCCQRFRLTTGVSPLVTAVLVPGCRFDSAPRHLGSPGRALGVLPALWGVAHPLCLPRCLPLPPLRRPPAPSILPSAALSPASALYSLAAPSSSISPAASPMLCGPSTSRDTTSSRWPIGPRPTTPAFPPTPSSTARRAPACSPPVAASASPSPSLVLPPAGTPPAPPGSVSAPPSSPLLPVATTLSSSSSPSTPSLAFPGSPSFAARLPCTPSPSSRPGLSAPCPLSIPTALPFAFGFLLSLQRGRRGGAPLAQF